MTSSIILIGPERAGKSTAGLLLADRVGLPFLALPSVARPYWEEIGFDEGAQIRAWTEGGAEGVYRYTQPFEAHAVERALAEQTPCIMEMAAPQSVYDGPELFERVRQALQPFENVVLLLPTPDVERSLRILASRTPQILINGMDFSEHFVKHHSNHDLAKHVVYTKGKTPGQTCDDILSRIDPSAGDIILIGPVSAGKSTQAQLLAERLGLPRVPMDDIRWGYYQEIGWDEATQNAIADKEGFAGVYRYWKRFELHAVERLLAEHRGCVIDFGGGHSVYEDEAQFARARDLLAAYANVVLLLPSPDLDESAAILRERQTPRINGVEANQFFLTHPSNHALAKFVVYTEGKSPEQTRDEILQYYHRPRAPASMPCP